MPQNDLCGTASCRQKPLRMSAAYQYIFILLDVEGVKGEVACLQLPACVAAESALLI